MAGKQAKQSNSLEGARTNLGGKVNIFIGEQTKGASEEVKRRERGGEE